MRKIKFRAWNKEIKKMWLVECLNWLTYGVDKIQLTCVDIPFGFDGTRGIPNELEWNISAFELMQFTGLLDKQGKEIYEGDIVHEKLHSHSPYIVKWEDSSAGFSPFNKELYNCDCCGSYYVCNNECEVIGNIYEDPKLLEEVNP